MSDSDLDSYAREGVRKAGKAGYWYVKDPDSLDEELDGYLSQVSIEGVELPVSGARIVIAPHAGYSYSGPCAAWAYHCLDLSNIKRIFILGPSHLYNPKECAVTTYSKWATPFGAFTIDGETLETLKRDGNFIDNDTWHDTEEHSMEMQLPYLWKRCLQTFGDPSNFPSVVPILVGTGSRTKEKRIGKLLSPYFKDKDNAFIISSDFCHWGRKFTYTMYSPDLDLSNLKMVSRSDLKPTNPPIHEFVRALDKAALDIVENGNYDDFADYMQLTKNTICGQHPIGIAMAAMDILREDSTEEQESTQTTASAAKYRFKVVQYDRSNPRLESPQDMSVSYVSAYAIL